MCSFVGTLKEDEKACLRIKFRKGDGDEDQFLPPSYIYSQIRCCWVEFSNMRRLRYQCRFTTDGREKLLKRF